MASLHRYKVQMTLLQTLFTPLLHPLHKQCLCGVASTIKILVGYVKYEFNEECGLFEFSMYRKYLISALQPSYSSFLADILDRDGKGTFGVEIQQPSALYETGSKDNRMKTIRSIAAIYGFSMSSASSVLVQLSRLLNHHAFTSLGKVEGEGRPRIVRLA